MINARMFNRRVIVECPYAGDPNNSLAQMYGPAEEWNYVGIIWASVEPIAGTEAVKGSGVQAGVLYRVQTRYRDDITERWRVKVPDRRGSASGFPNIGNGLYGRTLDIVSVIDVGGRHEVLEIMCEDNQSNV